MKTKFNGILTLLLALVVQISFAQDRTISGTVSDETGPLPGVSVLKKGTTSGTETDFDGKYSIKAKTGDVLVFSFVGMKTVEKVVGSSNNISFTMEGDNVLEEVVVTGYGTESRETVSSSVTVLSAEDVEGRPTASLVQALQSQSPGLNISTGNGQPGGNSVILLRGINSLSGNSEPLFIVDGVPVDEDNFRSINQNDIASVSVLKDASATAIYGNRATGGVIVITTKKGKSGQKLQIRYSGRSGFTFKPDPNFSLANSREILEIERIAGVGTGAGNYNPFVGSVTGLPVRTPGSPAIPLTDAQIATASQTNTDWTDILLRVGNFNSHDISLSTGSDNITSYTSLGYFEQEGITLRSKLQRMTVRNNTTYKTDKFTFNSSIGIGFSRSDIAGGIGTGGTSGSLSNPFLGPFVSKPYLPAYNADGSLNVVGDTDPNNSGGFLNTPYIIQNVARFDIDRDTELRITGALSADYNITDKFRAHVGFGLDMIEESRFRLEPTNSIRGSRVSEDVRGNPDAQFTGRQRQDFARDTRMITDLRLSYDDTIGEKHNYSVLGITEFNYAEFNDFGFDQVGLTPGLEGVGAGFVAGNTTEDPDGNGEPDFFYIPTLFSRKFIVSQFSLIGKATYDYDKIAGADFTIRRDGSSRFQGDNRFGIFWSVGGFVNLTKSLFDPSDFVNDIKLRGSYGITGNDRLGGGYYAGLDVPFDQFGAVGGYNGSVGLAPTQLGNRNIKWEETAKANIGVDFRLLQNKLTGSFDVYKNITTDLFAQRPATNLSTFSVINDNVGTMQNQGIEAILNYKLIQNENTVWSVGVNGSYNENLITELNGIEANANGEIILDDTQFSPEAVGHAFNEYYMVRWAGVNPANGSPLYLDRDGNLTEQFSDANRVFTGKSTIPKYQGGFNTSFYHKGFSLDAQFTFAAEVYRNNGTLGVAEDPTLLNIINVTSDLLGAWQQPGDITGIPALNTGSIRNLATTRYLEDASYIRLKNVAIGYELTNSLIKKSPFSSVKLYLQGENLLTWTKWRGFDPEFDPFQANDFFSFPNSRIVTLGVDLKL
ncbi:SusC/RagA family TonB-linked outer membrane protein [Tenacibaculum jejuense]|uniref:SusC-like TonB-dependent outer membrane receptor n=1 Tax=Tenacibaculum jejuense TaxID=584609 RepID=A0A238UES9_9FLAO|nr:SusC/RagA family TonB-linked outer membrane protein [Tenacibaculum jejuense]SNR17088.1 SusC-like TonB-dependent outer membrane receptor precursor [Tenacibaculum jejuense]